MYSLYCIELLYTGICDRIVCQIFMINKVNHIIALCRYTIVYWLIEITNAWYYESFGSHKNKTLYHYKLKYKFSVFWQNIFSSNMVHTSKLIKELLYLLLIIYILLAHSLITYDRIVDSCFVIVFLKTWFFPYESQ